VNAFFRRNFHRHSIRFRFGESAGKNSRWNFG